MKRATVRLGLSLVLALECWAQRLPAQTPTPPPPPAMVPAECASCADSSRGAGPGGPERKHLLTRVANKYGVGCNATHDSFGCGSAQAQLTFIFGSCRAFFGEPCEPPPPHRWRQER